MRAYLSARFPSGAAAADEADAAGEQVAVRPEVLRWYELRWCAQEIDDYATRILFSPVVQRGDEAAAGGDNGIVAARIEEQARCLAELGDYLPVDTEGLSKCSMWPD
eukprot:SAG22_NODE_241_length_14126_cov_9.747202_10_plen_107_part_00